MRNKKTLDLTLIAIFAALIILQSVIPNLGYIRIIPALPSISTLVLTVSIAGALLGPKSGLILGTFTGLMSLFVAYTQPADPLSLMLFQNVVIAVVPRALMGLFSGLVASAFKKNKNKAVVVFGYALSGFVTAATNTLLVIAFTSLFFMGDPTMVTGKLGMLSNNSPLIWILLTVLGFNGIVEATATAIFTPIITLPLAKVFNRMMNS